MALIGGDEDWQTVAQAWMNKGKYDKLLAFWSKGLSVDWNGLYVGNKPIRISLPTYPFAKERYWVPGDKGSLDHQLASMTAVEPLSPVILLPHWQESPVEHNRSSSYDRHVIFLCEPNHFDGGLFKSNMDSVSYYELHEDQADIFDRFQRYGVRILQELQSIILEKSKKDVLFQVVVPVLGEQQLFTGLSGMLHTAMLENPKFVCQLIEIDEWPNAEILAHIVMESGKHSADQHVRYENGKRYVKEWQDAGFPKIMELPWQNSGVYLITGGSGGLGMILAEDMAAKVPGAKLILTGKSTPRQNLTDRLKQWNEAGFHIEYHQVDVTEEIEMNKLINYIRTNFGKLDGIIYGAGVISDSYILNKTVGEFTAVTAPKTRGLMILDRLTADLNLNWFVLFSSISGVFGNVGQADYAAANAFMDAYSSYRNRLMKDGKRYGRTISIGWPLWEEGGMQVDEQKKAHMKQKSGLQPMKTKNGIQALYMALDSDADHILVLEGEEVSVRNSRSELKLPAHAPVAEVMHIDASDQARASVILRLKTIFAEAAKLEVAQIDEDERFENYGIDSFMIAALNNKLERWVGGISKTIFYEYQTLGDLADYLVETYPHIRKAVQEVTIVNDQSTTQITQSSQMQMQQPIAIIGISGRFPQSKNLEDYWDNLIEGNSCITEVPLERWDWRDHYVASKEEAALLGKSCSKWGAFLESIDQFDPKFFNMTPSEAEEIDPQERLFLEECWRALEDAGYASTTLSEDVRKRTGVFGGITKQGYNLFGSEALRQLPATSFSSMVNRVSYHLNIQGPSMPIDTMCSSSLVAIHEACEYIRQGKGDMAIAGGVNLYVHPSGYAQLSKGQLLSDSPIGNAFGRNGRGFVPGEGVGVVVLKPYEEAIKDGDHIHALIRGTAVNHSGRTNGYATPDPIRQAEVMQAALNQCGIDPNTVTYIEAAASGSEMGDAIEMSALTKAYGVREDSEQHEKYKIGSVKPIIGHCEAASGMSQLAKVVLSLQNQTLVPTPLHGELNPNINSDTMPFRIQRRLEDWRRVSIAGVEVPRRAGITSIGAGGVNAHIIVEEYIPDDVPNDIVNEESVLFILSAKNRDRLEQYAADWSAYLRKNQTVNLANIAYTLQVGREAMPCRLAFTTKNQAHLEQQLEQWLNKVEISEHCYERDNQITKKTLAPDQTLKTALMKNDIKTIAQYWVNGHPIAWQELHQGKQRHKVAKLPTYPFNRRSCWIGRSKTAPGIKQSVEMLPLDTQYSNKAIEFYTFAAKQSGLEFTEDYLTFCPFEEKVPGFSMSKMFLFPDQNLKAMQLMKSKQIELRQVLFCKEDFRRVHSFLDIGCGHGTDIIQVATLYPHISTHGFTITEAQAKLGNCRIEQKGLKDRATIFCKDSSKDAFPDKYDLVIGIEVSFHIRNKHGLFSNISASLNKDGRLLLMDYICNLKGAIIDPKVEISIPTVQDWVELLSEHNLIIDEIIDVSPEIANFLYDPFVDQNTIGLPEVTRDTYRNYANQSKSLENGWISYCLFKLKKETQMSREECSTYNATRIKNKTPYSVALEEMLTSGHIPYPMPKTVPDSQVNLTINSSSSNIGQSNIRPIKEEIMLIFEDVLGIQREDLDEHETFVELGIGSVNAVQLTEGINVQFDLRLPTSIVFEYNSLKELVSYVEGQLPKHSSNKEAVVSRSVIAESVSEHQVDKSVHKSDHDIAVVGLSCRCAGAEGPDEFWDIVSQGKETVSDLNNDAWKAFLRSSSKERLVNRYGVMKNRDAFDSKFFRISPKEAGAIDVSQRILLEECYKALEDAGYTPEKLHGKQVGTIIGAMGLTQLSESYSHFTMLGTDTSILAARIAYHLNLKGAAMAVNTACSSSLVAIDMACKQLKNGDIDMAVAGGITVYTHPGMFVSMKNAGMLSPTGQCRPFDQNADGIVVGDGAGVLILKRLADAQADGDHIYGVIRGSGTNQDGQTSGITVPSFQSQSQLQENVYRRNGIDVEDIQYIEAHGTATKLGDPIELHALTESFAKFTDKKRFCAIGSLKANIGHTTAAAGVLNVIKVLLSMQHEQIPPSINFNVNNEHIDFDNSPVYVNTRLTDWPVNTKGSRMAAVNSFGFSGTNAHVVIESYKAPARVEATFEAGVLPISAESKEGLHQYAKQLLDYLNKNEQTPIKDLVYSFQVGRQSMASRLAFEFNSRDMLFSQLQHYVDRNGAIPQGGYACEVGSNTGMLITDTEEGQDFIKRLAGGGKLGKLAELWVRGNDIHWEALYEQGEVRRLGGLPSYPFAKQKFLLPDPVLNNVESLQANPLAAPVLDASASIRKSDQQGISLASLQIAPGQQEKNAMSKPQIVLVPTDDLPVWENEQLEKAEESESQTSTILCELTEGLAYALYVNPKDIDVDRNFVDLGLDSIIGVEWIQKINIKFGISIPATKVYDYPTLREFADYITSLVSDVSFSAELQAIQQENANVNTEIGLDLLDSDLAYSLADALYMNSVDIDRDMNFIDMGLDSIIGVEWIKGINTRYSTSIPATKVYDYPTLREFTEFVRGELEKDRKETVISEAIQSLDEVLEQVYHGSIKAGQAQKILRKL
ncbi:SDR family NAD(P)-dependent oxidoreductase [Bacillus thuringiensis]|uniref:SDR family NAD(P)-dependent oxidoreductase n=2 Tax=Bacillus thuringiensis TaxID=1428 RepID=UPI003D19090C